MFNVNKFVMDNCGAIFSCVNVGGKLFCFLRVSQPHARCPVPGAWCPVQGTSAQLAPTLAPGTVASKGSETRLHGQWCQWGDSNGGRARRDNFNSTICAVAPPSWCPPQPISCQVPEPSSSSALIF